MVKSGRVKEKVAMYAFYVAIFFLSFILFNLLISTIFFIFNVGIQSWYVPCSFVLSTVLTVLLMKRRGIIKKSSILICIVLPILITCGLIPLNSKIYDYTYDGNSYHKLTIGMMMDGWNPLMETEEEFNEKKGEEKMDISGLEFKWGDYYAKASHIFAANIGKMTGSVESGKILNDLSLAILFLLVLALCLYIKKSWTFSVLFAFVMVTPTTVVSQLLTNYVDGLVYLYMFLLAALFFWFEYAKEYKEEVLGIFFATLVILINIKFSSFAYAGILCAVYYGWYIYRYKKEKKFDKKFFKRFSWTAFAAVVVGVFVVGLSVYPKNLVTHGHPFYPLMGEGKVDIMTENSPDYFKSKSNIEKFFIATFSKMDNFSEIDNKEAELKIPFAVYESEIERTKECDSRISGNGVFFGGILIVSISVILICARRVFIRNRKLFIMLTLPILMTIVMIITMSDVWWARYFPQLHFIVFAALIILDMYKNEFARAILYTLFSLIIVNNMIFVGGAIAKSYDYTKDANKMILAYHTIYGPDDCRVIFSTKKFPGGFYSVRNKFDKYEIGYESFDESAEYMRIMGVEVMARCEKK